ncbi:hypothetical protein [Aliamphritea spongicola]|nr:hypothetical protein [Aliamphritea spongicola]
METLLNNPLIQSSLLPLLLSLALTAAIGFSCDAGKKIAAVSIAASLLISIIQIQGFSAMPRSASQKLPYLIMIAGFAGLLIDTLNTRSRMLQTMSVIMPVTVLAWLFGGRISSIDAPGWATLPPSFSRQSLPGASVPLAMQASTVLLSCSLSASV